jgi:serine O-acetyltransferase
MLKQDIQRTYNILSGNKLSKFIGCFRSPGVHAMVTFRFGQWLLNQNILIKILLTPLYLFLYRRNRIWGIEIPRTASIGEGFYIGHHGGITISPKAKIGKNCNISQQVTIGIAGKGDKRGAPIIGDNVYIAPGAKLFGKITIGNNVKIGANAVIHKDIPDNAIVVLNPGYSILSYQDISIE